MGDGCVVRTKYRYIILGWSVLGQKKMCISDDEDKILPKQQPDVSWYDWRYQRSRVVIIAGPLLYLGPFDVFCLDLLAFFA